MKTSLVSTALFVLAGMVDSTAAGQPQWECDQSPLLIGNVFIHGQPEIDSLFVEDGRIAWIGNSESLPSGAQAARRLDGSGARALPGLVDSHTHFDSLPAAKSLQAELDVATEIFPVTLRQTLSSGVTTARVHLSAYEDMALMITLSEDACVPSPRLVMSGPGLLGGAPEVDARLMKGVSGPSDLKMKIDLLVEMGAEWAALHNPAQFSTKELEIIQQAAREGQIRFMADTDQFENLAVTLDLPVVSIEYLNRSEAQGYPEEILSKLSLVQMPLYLSAPVGYYQRSANTATLGSFEIDESLLAFMPSEMRSRVQAEFREAFLADQYIARAVSAFPTMATKFRQLESAGILAVAGSDSGSLGQFHADAIWQELQAWARFGFSAEEVLAFATRHPARMLQRDDIGALSPGMRGDIVLYRGSGSDELALAGVVAVVRSGIVFVNDGRWVGPDNDQTVRAIIRHRDRIAEHAE